MSNKKVTENTIYDENAFFRSEPIVIDEEEARAILEDDAKTKEPHLKQENRKPREFKEVPKNVRTEEIEIEEEPIEIQSVKEEIQESNADTSDEYDDDAIDDTFFDLPKRKKKALEKKRQIEKNKKQKKQVVEIIEEEEFVDEDDNEMIVEPQTKVKTKKRKNPLAILLNILAVLFFLFIIFETAIAFLNFSLVRQNKEPTYFVTTTKNQKDGYEYTVHDMGLFKIVRKENEKEYQVKLLPFFLNM